MSENACVLTGCLDGEGFFSGLCACDEEAAARLLDELMQKQRFWGARCVTGPVSPGLFDTEGGLPVVLAEDEASSFASEAAPYWDGLLKARGFMVERRMTLYALSRERLNEARYERAARESMRRFGYRVVSARSMGASAACAAMAALMNVEPLEGMPGEALYPALRSLGAAWKTDLSFLALTPGGEIAGYLIALYDTKTQTARAATIQVRACWQRKGVTAALGMAFWQAAASCQRVECGVIDEENPASRWSSLNAGGRPIRQFRRYKCEITNI